MVVRLSIMHDLLSPTRDNASLRHGGEAAGVTLRYRALTSREKHELLTFLDSL